MLLSKSKGFTLVELMVVMVVIASLAGVVIFTFPGARATARDAQRKSDVRQYQTSLEKYANLHSGFYPYSSNNATDMSGACNTLGETNCPEDPVGTNHYQFLSNGSGGKWTPSATSYIIYIRLEKPNPSQYLVACSNGNTGCVGTAQVPTLTTCTGNISTCP